MGSEMCIRDRDGIVRATSINASLSVLMLLGSAVLIFDLENRKKRLL